MSNRLKNHLYCFYAFALAVVVMLIARAPIQTICNAAFGAENGAFIANVILRIAMLIFAYTIICINKIRDTDEKRKYRELMSEQTFKFSTELKKIIKSKDMWGEVIFVSILTFIFWIFNWFALWVLMNIPIFIAFEIFVTLQLHYRWSKSI